jgi:predicted ArsR family transcriptional regulator
MTQQDPVRSQVDEFVLAEIESVPHLEALLLLWNSRPKQWSLEQMANALYISEEATHTILQDLIQRDLIKKDDSGSYFYNSDFKHKTLIEELDKAYRRELLRITRMIHSKAPLSVREFARAFRFKKD